MPFSTWAEVEAAMATGGALQEVHQIATVNGQSGGRWATLWAPAAQNFPVGTRPAAGLGSAVALSRSSVGAYPLPECGANGLVLAHATHVRASTQSGVAVLLDRLAHATIDHNQADGSFSPVIDATARLATGEGGMILVEVASALSAAANVGAFGYTNQDGTAGRTSQQFTTVASSVAHTVPFVGRRFLGLQSGDSGVRSIESWDLVSGTGTGTLTVAIVRPILAVPYGAYIYTGGTKVIPLMAQGRLPRIHQNACLHWIWLPDNNASGFHSSSLGLVQV